MLTPYDVSKFLTSRGVAVRDWEIHFGPGPTIIEELMEARGRERVLVIREHGAKMPADIGGGIYLSLQDRTDIPPIQTKIWDFIEKRI